MSEIRIKLAENDELNLRETLDCGQSFRWTENADGTFSGVAFGQYVIASMENNTLIINSLKENNEVNEKNERLWAYYFDLNLNYGDIKENLSCIHPIMKNAAEFAPGIRILNQEPWEALCSFIISQNNNIKRIKGIVNRFCTNFGDDLGENLYSFPTAKKISALSESDLSVLGAGYRSEYLIDAAQKTVTGELNLKEIKAMPIAEARQELQKVKGIGPKVADCVLLYGMHRLECFPMDVWMKRAMATLFPSMSPEDFGEYAGIAQQYIFHYSRMNTEMFES
ncbi:MAG: DNA-3-methyladenine glycosylase [Bacillota bacterium]|nr:DNA-3-methyladenine glycosylase [Bacillota bacterium]